MQKIGILGAGKLGITLAQIATKAGYEVLIASSKDPREIELTISVLAPQAQVASSETVINRSEIIILAIPLSHYVELNPELLKNKIVIDAMNYWWEVDGERPDLLDTAISTSELVQKYLKDSVIVKALNHMGYHDLVDESILNTNNNSAKKGFALAGDNKAANLVVKDIVKKFGFMPIVLTSLHDGIRLQPGTPAFGANVTVDELNARLAATVPGEFKIKHNN